MQEVRLIDANALIKDIAESIRLADKWEIESREKKDTHGLKCAIDTRRSLMAMISRIKEAPTIEAEPVRHANAIYIPNSKGYPSCSCCHEEMPFFLNFCPCCGAKMREGRH